VTVGAHKSVLRVRRWNNQLIVPHDHPDAVALGERVAGALEADLSRALSPMFVGARAADDSIVFIRRLDLDWTIGAEQDTAHIARQCAVALTQELAAELAAPESGNVVRFSTRSDYVAAYVTARATDDGATAWFYAGFAGWSALPASAAIRSALCADVDVGLAALRALTGSALAAVAARLDDDDAREIVRQLACAPVPSASDASQEMFDACLAVCPPAWLLDRRALGVWLLALTADGPAADADTIWRASATLLALHQAAVARGGTLDDAVLRAARDDRTVMAALAASMSADARVRVAANLLARGQANVVSTPPRASTAFGGAFLLLDDLCELPWDEIAAGWPDPTTAPALAALQLAVLGHSVAGAAWVRLFEDPFWRDRFGVPPTVAAADVTGPLDEGSVQLEAASARLLRRFARRLPGFATSSAEYLRRNFLTCAATIETEADRVVVTLSRPPLALIMTVAGLNRGVHRWAWLDPRPFVLFSEA
jgi:hypothetical protein